MGRRSHLAEVAGIHDESYALVAGAQALDDRDGPIRGPVVDKDDLVGDAERFELRGDGPCDRRGVLGFVQAGYYGRNLRPVTGLHGDARAATPTGGRCI